MNKDLGTTTSSTNTEQAHELRRAAADLLYRAACLSGVPALVTAQCKAACRLAAMQMREISIDSRADLEALSDNLREVARHIDPLVSAIGTEACAIDERIDPDLFEDQLFDAIDGNALYELSEAADRAAENDRQSDDGDRRYEALREVV